MVLSTACAPPELGNLNAVNVATGYLLENGRVAAVRNIVPGVAGRVTRNG
jgi:hypothetical protein